MTTGGSRTATTCRMEEAGLHFQGRGLRAGTQTFLTFIHIMEATLYRAGWGWWIQTSLLPVLLP